MWVSFFDNVYAYDLVGEELTVEDLFGRIRDTKAVTKSAMPLFKCARLGSLRTPPDPTNPRRGNSLRHDANVQMVSGIELDYDGESMPFAEAVDRLDKADVAFLAYTSPSHTAAKPRWRVVCPFSQELRPAERARYVSWVNGLLGGGLSRESWPISQAFYYGGINAEPEEMHLGDSERCIDEADFEAIAQPYTPSGTTTAGGKAPRPDFDKMTEPELLDVIRSGAHYWNPAKRLLAMWAKQGVSQGDAESNLISAFDDVPAADRGKKWTKEKAKIRRWVQDCYAKALKVNRTPAFAQLLAALEGEPHWHRAVLANAFTNQTEICTPWPPRPGQIAAGYRELADADILELLAHLQTNGAAYAHKATVWDVVTLLASRNERHPPREWLKSLKWDGVERVHRLFVDYFPATVPDLPHAQDQAAVDHRNDVIAYYEATAACFLVGLVARISLPGVKVDTLPCLIGPQGFLKSQGLQALMHDPAWFSDDLASQVGDRDTKEGMTGKWLIELSEFPHIRKDVDRVKAFFSRQTDRYRKAYGRSSADHPRQCGFCATTNELEFLDMSGNRRVWPIPLAASVNVTTIIADRDQLWAEAVHLYSDSVEWWLTPSLEAIAEELQDVYTEEDVWDEDIAKAINGIAPLDQKGNRPPFTRRDVLKAMGFCFIQGEPSCAKKADEMRAARRLRRLGYERDPHRVRGPGARVRYWIATPQART